MTTTPPAETGPNPQAGHLPTTHKRQPWKEFIHVTVGPAHNFDFEDESEGRKGDSIRLLGELDDKIVSG